MRKMLGFLMPIWWEVAIACLLVAIQAYLSLLLPDFMSNIAKIIQANASGQYSVSTLSDLIPIWGVSLLPATGDATVDTLIIGGIMLGIAFLFLIFALLSSILISKIGAFFGREVRKALFHKVTSFGIGEYDKYGTATLITRTTNDIEQTQTMLQMSLRIIIMSPVTLIVAIIMILNKDPTLALIVACSIPVMLITVLILYFNASPIFELIQKGTDKLTMILRQSLTGVRVVRAFNQEEHEAERFDESNKDLTKLNIKVGRIMSFANPVIGVTFDLVYIAIYFYGFAQVNGKTAGVDSAVVNFPIILASAQYAMQIMQSFIMFSLLFIMFPRAEASIKRINAVLSEKIGIVDPIDPLTVESHEGIVEFKDVTFQFPDSDAPTLSHINFATKPGSTTAIIGSTGSGKSSVVNLIPRFFDVTSGEVDVDGVDVRKFTQYDLRARIGFVPQQALLFSGSIRDNIKFGDREATDQQIADALDVAQATHFVSKKEKGIDSEVEQGGKNFSGGQKQRLAIARALVKKPEIYVFDDSFSALDFKTDIKLRMALKSFIGNASVIIVAQRVSTILDADDIIVLEEGKIVGEGKHNDLLKTCKVYQEIVFSQLDKDEIEKTLELAKAESSAGGER